jgi:hypothetical protein
MMNIACIPMLMVLALCSCVPVGKPNFPCKATPIAMPSSGPIQSFCHSSAETVPASTCVLSDDLAVALMKYYMFAAIPAPGDVVMIGGYSAPSDEHPKYLSPSHEITDHEDECIFWFRRIIIWWPDANISKIDQKRILREAVWPVYEKNIPDSYSFINRRPELDKQVYMRMKRLTGIEDIEDIIEKRRRSESSGKADLTKGPEVLLAYSERRLMYQDLSINKAILEKINHIYPDLPAPSGIYIHYEASNAHHFLWY